MFKLMVISNCFNLVNILSMIEMVCVVVDVVHVPSMKYFKSPLASVFWSMI